MLGGGWDRGGCFVPQTGLPPLQYWSPSPPNQLWVHNLAPQLAQPTGSAVERVALKKVSAGLHESLKLVATTESGAPFDLLKECDVNNLLTWLGSALPGSSRRAEGRLAALYADEDEDSVAGRWQPCLQMRLNINDVGFLHELRDAVLTGTLEETLSRTPLRVRTQCGKVRVVVSIDRSQFAAVYEGSVLSMDKLTPHQLEKLKECLTADYVHLKAPAGAGKTFVALNRVLELLHNEKEARALFVARNAALCYFVVRWVCRRERNPMQRMLMLQRVDVLF